MNVSYDWYKVFCQVAESGSITVASALLFISQPAVSQCIRQLETTLGCTLFIRTPKGVRLTSEGELFYNDLSKGIDQIRLGEKNLQAQLTLEYGEITIGASDMTLEYFLLPYLEIFHRMYPKIRISITNGPTPETMSKFFHNTIDFGVVSEPVNGLGPDCSLITVKEIEDIFITDTERSVPSTLTACQLMDYPIILLENGTSTRGYIDRFSKKPGS